MKVIIAGGRNFTNYSLMKEKVEKILSNQYEVIIISGKAKGADALGERLALEKRWNLLVYPAKWDEDGKAAGYKRNVEMAKEADAAICFWDGFSKGTEHMINISKELGLKLRVVRY